MKAIQSLEDIHFAIVRSYLKATGLQSALLLNFCLHALNHSSRKYRRFRTNQTTFRDFSDLISIPEFLISK